VSLPVVARCCILILVDPVSLLTFLVLLASDATDGRHFEDERSPALSETDEGRKPFMKASAAVARVKRSKDGGPSFVAFVFDEKEYPDHEESLE
jgi:hypothetical protein